jgi:anti-anti-sigma factor
MMVALSGDLDSMTAAITARELDAVQQRPPRRLVIDATAVGRCDAAGLATITSAAFAVRSHGGVVRLTASAPVAATVHACGLEDYLGLDGRCRIAPRQPAAGED